MLVKTMNAQPASLQVAFTQYMEDDISKRMRSHVRWNNISSLMKGRLSLVVQGECGRCLVYLSSFQAIVAPSIYSCDVISDGVSRQSICLRTATLNKYRRQRRHQPIPKRTTADHLRNRAVHNVKVWALPRTASGVKPLVYP